MLVTCPRCGFQQPKDKYCAQCGVDMESYKPQTAPWYKTFYKNLGFQMAFLLAIAGGSGFYIYQNHSSQPTMATVTSRTSLQMNASKNFPPPPPPAPDVNAASTTAQPPIAPGEAMSVTESSSLNAKPDATAKPEEKKETRALAAKTSGPHLTVYYAEVTRPALARLAEASRATGQFMNFADYSAGIIPGMDRKIHADGVKILKKEERNLDTGKTLQWSYGLKDRSNPSVEIGLTTFFELADIDGNTLRGNLEIQRTWRESVQTGGFEIQRKSFPAIFEIGGENGFFMSGVMPTQSNIENDDELTSIDVYKVLRSPQFRAGESEFVIFVEYDNK